jgi:hypothetical protein
VSPDFGARVRRALPLAELIAGTRRVQAELLGLPTVPPLTMVAGRSRDHGRIADPGLPLGDEQLRTILIGPGIPGPGAEVVDPGGGRLVTILSTPRGRPASEVRSALAALGAPAGRGAAVVPPGRGEAEEAAGVYLGQFGHLAGWSLI